MHIQLSNIWRQRAWLKEAEREVVKPPQWPLPLIQLRDPLSEPWGRFMISVPWLSLVPLPATLLSVQMSLAFGESSFLSENPAFCLPSSNYWIVKTKCQSRRNLPLLNTYIQAQKWLCTFSVVESNTTFILECLIISRISSWEVTSWVLFKVT